MSKIKALIVGVSDYSIIKANNLPFCSNDIRLMKDAFVYGLNVNKEDVVVCGENKVVTSLEFIDE